MKKCSSELFMKYDYESITLNIVLRQILFYSIDFFSSLDKLAVIGCWLLYGAKTLCECRKRSKLVCFQNVVQKCYLFETKNLKCHR